MIRVRATSMRKGITSSTGAKPRAILLPIPAPTKIDQTPRSACRIATTNVSSTRHISSSGEIMLLADNRRSPIAPKMFSLNRTSVIRHISGTSPSAIRRRQRPRAAHQHHRQAQQDKRRREMYRQPAGIPGCAIRLQQRVYRRKEPKCRFQKDQDRQQSCLRRNVPARPRKRKMISRLRDRQAQRAEQHRQRHRNAHARRKGGQICRKWWKEPTGKDGQRHQRHHQQACLLQDGKLLKKSRIRLSGRQGCSAQRHGVGGEWCVWLE